MSKSEDVCIGCSEDNFSCVSWKHLCPCTECLVKCMCQDSCEKYDLFEKECTKENQRKYL